jgi:hypothetical protein
MREVVRKGNLNPFSYCTKGMGNAMVCVNAKAISYMVYNVGMVLF